MTQDQLLAGLKKDVRSLLISAKHGLTPEQLRRDYQVMVGRPMPLRSLGFHGVLDMVREMPDVAHVAFHCDGSQVLKAVGDESTRGVEELVSKQRSRAPKAKNPTRHSRTFQVRYPHHQSVGLPRRGQAVPPLPAHLCSQLKQLLSHGPVRLSELESRYAALFGKPLQITQYGFFSINQMLTAATGFIEMQQSRTGSRLTLKGTGKQGHIKSKHSVAKDNPADVGPTAPIHQKCEKTQQVSHVQPAVPKADPPKREESFHKIVLKLEKELRHRILEKGTAGTVSNELKDKLRKVVAENNNGMSIHSLPTKYQRMYGEELPVSQCGFLSVTEMVGALSDTLTIQSGTEEGENCWIVAENKPNDTDHTEPELSPGHSTASSLESESQNASGKGFYFSCTQSAWEGENEELSTDWQDTDSDLNVTSKTIHQMVDLLPVLMVSQWTAVPPDAVLCQKLKPPTRRKERELVPVLVEQIESPSRFYVRFSQNTEARALENMMIEMRSCYSCPDVNERYRLPDAYVRLGQVCCVAPRDIWFYRVVIHEVLSATEVTVYYVDFGDISKVERHSLRFLKACYADLAAQAVPSILAGIRPIKSSWTESAINSFHKMCCERTLVAAVHTYQENFLLLFLCDTSTDEDVYIHLTLQEKGHAMPCTSAYRVLSGKFNPLNCYFGDDRLQDIKHVTSTTTIKPQSSKVFNPERTETLNIDPISDLPELEFITVPEVNKTSENVHKVYVNPSEVQQNKEAISCNEWDQGWTTEKKTDETDLRSDAQTEEGLKPENESPPPPVPAPVNEPLSCATPAEPTPVAQSRCASPLLPLTPQYTVQTNSSYAGVPIYPIQPQMSNFMLQLFSSPDMSRSNFLLQHHVFPFALRPTARLSASPFILHQWCTKKKA